MKLLNPKTIWGYWKQPNLIRDAHSQSCSLLGSQMRVGPINSLA